MFRVRHGPPPLQHRWVGRNGARIAGLAFGTLGTVIITISSSALTGDGYIDLSDGAAPTVFPISDRNPPRGIFPARSRDPDRHSARASSNRSAMLILTCPCCGVDGRRDRACPRRRGASETLRPRRLGRGLRGYLFLRPRIPGRAFRTLAPRPWLRQVVPRRARTVTLEVFGTYPAQTTGTAAAHPRRHPRQTPRLERFRPSHEHGRLSTRATGGRLIDRSAPRDLHLQRQALDAAMPATRWPRRCWPTTS